MNGPATESGPGVAFADVTVRYGAIAALDAVDLTVAPGSFVALVGESGSGKSTLLRTINRMVVPDAGQITLNGADVAGESAHRLRRRIGYAFQGVGLFPHLDVAANIAMPARIAGARLAEGRVADLLELVGLDPALASRRPAALSGGQAQRVGFARALATGSRLMLLDEPFGALDPVTRDRIAREYRAIHDRLKLTSIMVTHDMAEALLVADRIAVLSRGRLVTDETPGALLNGAGGDIAQALVAVPRAQAEALLSLEGRA